MHAVLAAGVLPFAWIVGRITLGRLAQLQRVTSVLERNLLIVGAGIAAMTPLLVGLALTGRFDADWIGGFGWLCTAGWGYRAHTLHTISIAIDPPRRITRGEVIVIAVAAVAALVGYWGREPTLGFGRDQQVYAEYAISLARFGTAAPRFDAKDIADEELIRTVTTTTGFFLLPGMLPMHAGRGSIVESYLPIGWTVWLAFAYVVGGINLLYGANAIVMGASVLLVFAVARRLTDEHIALGASILFASTPLSVWIARISLSEPLALFLLLLLPLASFSATKRSRSGVQVLVLLGACCVRVDAIVAVPALMLSLLAEAGGPETHGSWQASRRAILTLALTSLVVCVAYAWLFPRYFSDLSRFVRPVLTAVVAISTVACVPRVLLGRAMRIVRTDGAAMLLILALVGLFAYAAIWRPSIQPFSLIPFAGGLTGTRDFREEAVRNFAAYTGWPLLIAAVGGACIALRRAIAPAASRALRVLVVLSLTFALLYLWAPHVSPDQPWGARRFVPVILPAVALFASILVYAGIRRLRGWTRSMGALLLAAASLPAWPAQYMGLRHIDNRQSIGEIDAIASAVPSSLVVLDERLQNVAAALFVAYHRQVAVLPLDTGFGRRIAYRWIRSKEDLGHVPWLLEAANSTRSGARVFEAGRWTVQRVTVKREDRAPANQTQTEALPIVLWRFDGLDVDATERMFGGNRTWGVPEHGFYTTDLTTFGAFRYTDGGAMLEIPTHSLLNADALKVDLFTNAPGGERRWLRLLVDGQRIWDGQLNSGLATVIASLPPRLTSGREAALLEIWSATTRRAVTGLDPRSLLGVGLVGIRPVRIDELGMLGPSMEGFASSIQASAASESPSVSPGRDVSVELTITNDGAARWPTIRDTGQVRGAVQIGLRWYRADQPTTIVGDNRWAMAVSLLPGDRIRMTVPLDPIGLDGKPLPQGKYDVRIGMVREGYAWFSDSGDRAIRIPVDVTH